MKLKKRVKDKLVKALRSGEYDQGFFELVESTEDGDCFCALGVLVNETLGFIDPDIARPFAEIKSLRAKGLTHFYDGVPNILLIDKVFCKKDKPTCWQKVKLEYKGKKQPIWRLNDEEKLSFEQMADLIEAQL